MLTPQTAGAGNSSTGSAARISSVSKAATVAPWVNPKERRQLWVWHPAAVDPAVLVADATRNNVTDLLVWVSPGWTKSAATVRAIRTLKTAAEAAGQRIVALCGDVSWALQPGVAGTWAREVAASKLFSRVHLDVEPHSMPAWQVDPAPLVAGMLAAFTNAAKAGLPVDVDIPTWYHTVPAGGGLMLDEAVMRRTDTVTLMAYRNTAAAVLAAVDTTMTKADRLKEKVWIGLNFGPTGGDHPSTTYQGMPSAQVLTDLGAIRSGAGAHASFTGLALHDSDHLPQ